MLRNTVSATIVGAGDKVNVVAVEATVELDGRMLPGFAPEALLAELRAWSATRSSWRSSPRAGRAEPDLALFEPAGGVLRERDPGAKADADAAARRHRRAHLRRLGIQTYGFLPMQLPQELPFTQLLHAADERVPVETLEFGAGAVGAVLERYGRTGR